MFFILGPCVIESEKLVLNVAEHLRELSDSFGFDIIFKSSFDKANRSSTSSYRGPGLHKGLKILERVKNDFGLKILTDVHEYTPIDEVSSVVDILQTPAFLVRQTDFIQNVAKSGKPVNVKKGQFQSPYDVKNVVDKCSEVGNKDIWLCDRGTCFGYNTLISDMRSLSIMRKYSDTIVFDATHSVQEPGSNGISSGGNRRMVPVLARAAAAVGVDAIFMETHPCPESALSDGPNMIPIDKLKSLLITLERINTIAVTEPLLEDHLY